MVLLASSIAVKLLIPWLAAQAINAIQVEGASALASAAGCIATIFGVYVAAWSMHGPGRILERRVALMVRGRFADSLYGKLASLMFSGVAPGGGNDLGRGAGAGAHRSDGLRRVGDPVA